MFGGEHSIVIGNTLSQAFAKPNFQRFFRTMEQGIQFGQLDVTLPDGSTYSVTGNKPGPHGIVHLRSWGAIPRIAGGGELGLAEVYMDGLIDTTNLKDLMDWALTNQDWFLSNMRTYGWSGLLAKIFHFLRPNSKDGSRRNIADHYDLGNAFYSEWLDNSMTYSSAVFEGSNSDDLYAAQQEKYKRIAETAQMQPGDQVLEIGCGWGGFAEYAVKNVGVNMTCITISQEQHDFAAARFQREGISDKIELRMQDYRDTEAGRYDRVASIEMIEAVGEKYWDTYFGQIAKVLKPGGAAAIQAITVPDDKLEEYLSQVDFISRYIFPGGRLLSHSRMKECTERVGMQYEPNGEYGKSYAKTLLQWNDKFQAAWTKIRDMGFDERFKRMWEYYLIHCSVGFDFDQIGVTQVRLQKPA
jgi:cyclopropane-fatty-acyl-phospholipid synthase